MHLNSPPHPAAHRPPFTGNQQTDALKVQGHHKTAQENAKAQPEGHCILAFCRFNLLGLCRNPARCHAKSGRPNEFCRKGRAWNEWCRGDEVQAWGSQSCDTWRTSIRMLAAVISVLILVLLPGTLAHTPGTEVISSIMSRSETYNASSFPAPSSQEGDGFWWMPTDQRGFVLGQSLLTVAGTQFNLSFPYVARFSGINEEAEGDPLIEVESAPQNARSPSKLVLSVPPWPAHETNVTVSLYMQIDSRLHPMALRPGSQAIFEYVAGWESMTGASVPLWYPPSEYAQSYFKDAEVGVCSPVGTVGCSALVSGGSFVTITGAGFQQRHCPEFDFCADVWYRKHIRQLVYCIS